MITSDAPLSARGPGHGAAAQHVGVHVEHRLARLRAGVEDDAVAAAGDALILRHPVRLGRHLRQQAITGADERGQVWIVVPGDDEDVRGRLRIDVTESYGAIALRYKLSGHVPCNDLAKEAFCHKVILACGS